jgi:hypothetical protein
MIAEEVKRNYRNEHYFKIQINYAQINRGYFHDVCFNPPIRKI